MMLTSYAFQFVCAAVETSPTPYELLTRLPPKSFLQMPERANGSMPPLLSQTRVFNDIIQFVLSDELIPYDIVVPF